MLRKFKTYLIPGACLALTVFGISALAQTAESLPTAQPAQSLQSAPPPKPKSAAAKKRWPRLISFAEGRQILEAAWEHRGTIDYKPDCSHLVHEVYSLVGLDYAYAPSRELYHDRVAAFRRVFKPQPGDLIVWLGHVGIVVSPLEHSFYSSLNSGLLTDSYLKRYWRARGTPRFYRYRQSAEIKRPQLDVPRSMITHLQSSQIDPVITTPFDGSE